MAEPVIVILPDPVDVMQAEVLMLTPRDICPVPQEVPLIVRLPELAVTEELLIITPQARCVPFAAVPVMVTLPEPADVTLEELLR